MVRKPALLLDTFPGRVGSARSDDGNSDNRANSAQFQVKLPTGAELGKILLMKLDN